MKHQLRAAGGVNLPVIGVFDGILRYASKQIRKQIFVVKNQKNSLLSKSACVELGLIKLPKPDEINEINQNQNSTKSRSGNAEDSKKSSEPDFCVEFPELFSGLEKIKMDPYKTTLKPNAESYCNGIKADSEKRRAIINFPTPGNITDLQRFNGMVSELGKFIPGLAEINLPLRQLLRKNQSWLWGPTQEEAFQRIKDALLEPHTLAHYDTSKPTVIAADVCKSGIGAVMLQIQEDGNRQPVCFASRSLTNAELEYAVIEKKHWQ